MISQNDHILILVSTNSKGGKKGEQNSFLLFKKHFRGSFAEHTVAAISHLQHCTHRFTDRVKGVDFVEFLLRDLCANSLVVAL